MVVVAATRKLMRRLYAVRCPGQQHRCRRGARHTSRSRHTMRIGTSSPRLLKPNFQKKCHRHIVTEVSYMIRHKTLFYRYLYLKVERANAFSRSSNHHFSLFFVRRYRRTRKTMVDPRPDTMPLPLSPSLAHANVVTRERRSLRIQEKMGNPRRYVNLV